MPSKETKMLKTTGTRFNPLTRELVKEFRKKTGIKLTFEDARKIVYRSNELLQQAIIEDEAGIKFPIGGNIVVTKYKNLKEYKDWANTNTLGKAIPLLNLHSFGYIYHIKWFKMGCRFRFNYIYKFRPIRPLTRSVAKNIKAGKLYHQWQNTDFWSTTRMERMLEKFYKNKSE